MDFKYLYLRYQAFRDEYLELTHKWLKNSGSWLWQFSIDNFKFLYLGEIHQIRLLLYTLEQKRDYIKFLQVNRRTKETDHLKLQRDNDNVLLRRFLFIARMSVLPVSFMIYWIRRIYRMILNREIKMLVSDAAPTEDRIFSSSFSGNGNVYIFPEKRQSFPRGLVIFRYTLSVSSPSADSTLYINPGFGFVSEYTIPLPYSNDEKHELLLEVPPDTALMMFQASSVKDDFAIADISMTEIGLIQAVRYLKMQYNFNTDDVMNALYIRKLPGVRRIIGHKISYPDWYYKYSRLSRLDHIAIQRHISAMVKPPLLSLIISINNDGAHQLDLSLQSVQNQIYPHWELLLTCVDVPDAHIVTVLNHYERHDDRIKLMIGTNPPGISHVITDAVLAADGAISGFLHQGDLLTEHALYMFACKLIESPHAKVLYSDHDYIDESGSLFAPCLKPDWNYDFFLGKNYLERIVFYQTEGLKDRVANDKLAPAINSYRLNIQMIEQSAQNDIVHIPYVLLHIRDQGINGNPAHLISSAYDKQLLVEHLARTTQEATVVPHKTGFHIKRTVPAPEPLVSLIVLTRDRVALLSNCIHGVLHKTAYQNLEILIVDNGSIEHATLTYLEALSSDSRVRVLKRPGEFNFSDLNNHAISHAHGEYICLLNNDISIIKPDWLAEMMGHLVRPEVGIVGAKLLYENNTVQHAGVIVGLGALAGHGFRHAPAGYNGYGDRLVLCQQLSCVTAACMLTKKSIYQSVGGLDTINLRVAYNDVDYCLKVREQGWKIIWTPFAELYHLESASRESDLSKDQIERWQSEYNFMRAKWRDVLEYDPFYNPNLSLADEEFALARPPRLVHPWERYKYLKPATANTGNQ